jgi:hypothetical protein
MKAKARRPRRGEASDPLDQLQAGWDSSFLNFLDDESGWSLHVYCKAYLQAAKCLMRSLLRLRWGGMKRDAGVIPILFLWRHYLEISLKAIIAEIADYKDKTPPVLTSEHRLFSLWALAKNDLKDLVLDDEEVEQIGSVVHSFSTVDPASQAFRYPTLKSGSRAAPGLRVVDLRRLDKTMTKASAALEMARGGLDGLLHQKREAQEIWRDF